MKIIENVDNNEVIIGNKKMEGFISDEECDSCTNLLIYFDKYDAYFCPYCNEWKENTCADPECEFCKNRPKKPL